MEAKKSFPLPTEPQSRLMYAKAEEKKWIFDFERMWTNGTAVLGQSESTQSQCAVRKHIAFSNTNFVSVPSNVMNGIKHFSATELLFGRFAVSGVYRCIETVNSALIESEISFHIQFVFGGEQEKSK